MSLRLRNIGIVLATGCGVLTSYSVLAPELQKQAAAREAQEYGAIHGQVVAPLAAEQEAHSNSTPKALPIAERVTSESEASVLPAVNASVSAQTSKALTNATPGAEKPSPWSGMAIWPWIFGGTESSKADHGDDTKP
ncbi:hypothetical protein LTR66_002444 [Elasticomyces elasticus]|nr:hypothetical protein LTR66_002444 [Elasticomyces elasticus]